MAKTFKPKNEGVTVVDEVNVTTVEEGVENTVENPVEEIEVNKDIEQMPAIKMVKICPNTNHNCTIGGIRYCLKKGVQVNVPQEVKTILNKSGLLMPL